MWCLEMQLYPVKRCDAQMPEDLREYDQYRADVEKYREQQQGKLQHDLGNLQQLNQNCPVPAAPPGRYCGDAYLDRQSLQYRDHNAQSGNRHFLFGRANHSLQQIALQ